MSRALGRFKRVALIGCDIPEANAADVHDAFRALGVADAVFGPTADGGYWLIALGPRRPADLFGAARWSTEHALADTLRQFRRHRVGFIRHAIRCGHGGRLPTVFWMSGLTDDLGHLVSYAGRRG